MLNFVLSFSISLVLKDKRAFSGNGNLTSKGRGGGGLFLKNILISKLMMKKYIDQVKKLKKCVAKTKKQKAIPPFWK